MLLPGLTLAQSLGTKSDVIKVPKTPMAAPAMPGGMELIQLLAGIVIVGLIIKFVLPKFIKAGKFNRKAKSIEIEESMESAVDRSTLFESTAADLLSAAQPPR